MRGLEKNTSRMDIRQTHRQTDMLVKIGLRDIFRKKRKAVVEA